MELMILIAQTSLTAFLAAWLTTGVRDNIVAPDVNRSSTTQVLRLERLEKMYPDEFRLMSARRIDDQRLHRAAFAFIVFCELAVSIALWGAVLLMALSIFGVVALETAKIAALAAVLGFTSIWAGFLILGNYFSYWMAHEWAQNTHYQMLLWGIATMVFLVVA